MIFYKIKSAWTLSWWCIPIIAALFEAEAGLQIQIQPAQLSELASICLGIEYSAGDVAQRKGCGFNHQ